MADDRRSERELMIAQQLLPRGITDRRVLDAMAAVPRHLFLDEQAQQVAYSDAAQPISAGQTISQPFIVALMAQVLQLQPSDRVLEIGTGSGYAAAVLAELAAEVYTVERHEELAQLAASRLRRLPNVYVLWGDGTAGWPEHAPFDAITIAAAAPEIPPPLIAQLADGGRLVAPVGTRDEQRLVLLTRQGPEIERRVLSDVRFVPLIGEWGWDEQR